MNEWVPMSRPELDETDVEAVARVIRSGRLALGSQTAKFESLLADYIGVRHVVAVSSGTAALHLIVRALGLGPRDEVILPSFTFAASANALLLEGCVPVFADIEPETMTVSPEDIERKISPRTKAVMAVDVFGHPADWDEILRIADQYGLKVIDDCCEAIGAEYDGRKVGQFGNAGAFSFYPNKQMTLGEGGAVVTNDSRLADNIRSVRNQGRDVMTPWLEHARLGWNYRLDEMSAALGVSQIARLSQFLAKRERVAQSYTRRLGKFDWVRPPQVKPWVRMSWCFYAVTLAEGISRDQVARGMAARGIPARCYFPPLHLQPYVSKGLDGKQATLPVTESVAGRILALPFFNDLREDQIAQIVEGLEESVQEATGWAESSHPDLVGVQGVARLRSGGGPHWRRIV